MLVILSLQRFGGIFVVPLGCVLAGLILFGAYRFNLHYYEPRIGYQQRLKTLQPLGFNANENTVWMARPGQVKMLKDQRYLYSWYTSFGHGLVVVFLFTVL